MLFEHVTLSSDATYWPVMMHNSKIMAQIRRCLDFVSGILVQLWSWRLLFARREFTSQLSMLLQFPLFETFTNSPRSSRSSRQRSSRPVCDIASRDGPFTFTIEYSLALKFTFTSRSSLHHLPVRLDLLFAFTRRQHKPSEGRIPDSICKYPPHPGSGYTSPPSGSELVSERTIPHDNFRKRFCPWCHPNKRYIALAMSMEHGSHEGWKKSSDEELYDSCVTVLWNEELHSQLWL
jgi:hypothetical protein